MHCRIFSHFKIKFSTPPSFPPTIEHAESGNLRKTNLSAHPTPTLSQYMEVNIEVCVCVQESSLKLQFLKILV